MGNSENLFENENNGEELNQEIDQPLNEENSEQGNEQQEYSYTYSNDDGDTVNGETEPTVTFDSVSELHENRRNNGVKVFFSIIALEIAKASDSMLLEHISLTSFALTVLFPCAAAYMQSFSTSL